MKSRVLLALIGSIAVVPGAIGGSLSAEYQAAIREATERYRGDCTGVVTLVVHETYLTGSDVGILPFEPFPDQLFALGSVRRLDGTGAASVSLQRLAPNQALQLTATRYTFTFYHD